MCNKLLTVVICLACIFCSCKENRHSTKCEVIKINPLEINEEINISEIADSVKYIKLQTDSNCVLGRLHDIFIMEKYIYAFDVSQQILFVFNKNGDFVSKLDKRGNGPDEYKYMGPMFIDKNEDYIEFISFGGKNKTKLLKYSNISFKLIDKVGFPYISSNSCKYLDGYYYFATQQIENTVNDKSTNADLIIVKNNKIAGTLFDKTVVSNNQGFSPYIESFVCNEKNELFVSIPYKNTFYQLNRLDADPILTVDFGKYGIDNSLVEKKPIDEQIKYIEEINGKALFPVLNIYNQKVLSFSYFFKKGGDYSMFRKNDLHQYLKFIKANKVYHAKMFKNDITNFPDYFEFTTSFSGIAHQVYYNDYLVSIVKPSDCLAGDKTSINVKDLGTVDVEDNPVIVLVKLKRELL